MPDLTTAENDLLKRLSSSNVLTMGKARMKEASNLIYRLMHLADEATKDYQASEVQLKEARFNNSALAVAALGMVPKEDIAAKASLSEQMRDTCLQLRQNFDDAIAWRASQAAAQQPPTDDEATR